MNRRIFLKKCIISILFGLKSFSLLQGKASAGVAIAYNAPGKGQKKAFLRPPGALPEKKFLSTCINCHRCGQSCTNDCIKYVNSPFQPMLHDTPYIRPREKACVLCMKCTQACPSGALVRVGNDDGNTIQKHVKMGLAVVDENICNSFNGYACGVCVRACPFSGVALLATNWEKPKVSKKDCVGCGLCEQSCIHYPQAIRVYPIQLL